MKTNSNKNKLTDEEFIEALRICEYNYAETAKYIQKQYKVPYSKQAVSKRAQNFPDEREHLFTIMGNESSTRLMTFACDEGNDIKLRARIYSLLLNKATQHERLKKEPNPEDQPYQVIKVGNLVLCFIQNGIITEQHRQVVVDQLFKKYSLPAK